MDQFNGRSAIAPPVDFEEEGPDVSPGNVFDRFIDTQEVPVDLTVAGVCPGAAGAEDEVQPPRGNLVEVRRLLFGDAELVLGDSELCLGLCLFGLGL